MSFSLRPFNALFYEPESVRPELRIAQSVLTDVETKANGLLQDVVLPELVKLGLVPEHTGLVEFAACAHELPAPIAAKISIPEEERFVLNIAPYERLGHVPGVLGEFAKLYQEMAPQGIAVTFFNTACAGPTNDYQRLAEIVDQFPAVRSSTWVVTESLREPMPEAFRELVVKLAGAANPAGAAAKQLAVTSGSPCYVSIGDSIVVSTVKEASGVILERLKFLRKTGQAGKASP